MAAKLRQDEIEKEKELRLMKIKDEHRPVSQLDIKKH